MLKPLNILVVEDHQRSRKMLEEFLNELGHIGYYVESGIEATKFVQEQVPDLILMDVMLPKMDGYAATKAIRKYLGNQWVPVIFLSAMVTVEDQLKGLEVGGDDYLLKPIDLRLLEAKIKSMRRIVSMQEEIKEQTQRLKDYHDFAEQEKDLARGLMERITRSGTISDNSVKVYLSPTEKMSGDMACVAKYENNRTYVMVADATGHGLPAALSQFPISQIFYQMAEKGYCVSSIVSEMNRKLKQLLPVDRFIAASVAMIDYNNHAMEIWNGGNPDVLVVDSKQEIQARFVSEHCALGILQPGEFQSNTKLFTWDMPGTFIFYSDGVVEAQNREQEDFGEQGILKALQSLKQASASNDEIFAAVKMELENFLAGKQAHDDMTLVTVSV